MSKTEEIYILNRRLRLLQPHEGFRTCTDSVLLAAACPAKEGETILDLGCGVGGAGLCILKRVPSTSLTGIDLQTEEIALAQENAKVNGIEQTKFIQSCVTEYKGDRFDHVICNPPYMEDGKHTPSPKDAKAKAHGHEETNLKDWIDAAFRNLKSRGSFTIIHRADQTDEIIKAMGKRFGALEIIPLWPKQGVQAKRVIIRALKDRRSPATLHAGLVLHQENGEYTPEAENILREVAPLL